MCAHLGQCPLLDCLALPALVEDLVKLLFGPMDDIAGLSRWMESTNNVEDCSSWKDCIRFMVLCKSCQEVAGPVIASFAQKQAMQVLVQTWKLQSLIKQKIDLKGLPPLQYSHEPGIDWYLQTSPQHIQGDSHETNQGYICAMQECKKSVGPYMPVGHSKFRRYITTDEGPLANEDEPFHTPQITITEWRCLQPPYRVEDTMKTHTFRHTGGHSSVVRYQLEIPVVVCSMRCLQKAQMMGFFWPGGFQRYSLLRGTRKVTEEDWKHNDDASDSDDPWLGLR